MAVDVSGFIAKTRPPNLFSLMERKAAIHLLNGFSYALRAGVAVMYSTENPAQRSTLEIESFMKGSKEAHQFAHPFCREYRHCDDSHEVRCVEWDQTIALRYYDGEWSGPRLYQCHLGVWDMSYPLVVDGHLLGVLFSGQMIVDGGPHNWREALGRIAHSVDWPSVDEINKHTDTICGRLQEQSIPASLTALTNIVIEDSDDRNIMVELVPRRYAEFVEFGDMLTSLLAALHRLRRRTEEQILLRDMASELITRTASAETWWAALAEISSQFQLAAEVGAIEVYCREDLGYVQRVANGAVVPRAEAKWISAHVCLEFPSNRLMPLSEVRDWKQLAAYMRIESEALVYRSELAVLDDRRISMIFVVHDAGERGHQREFVQSFCESIGLRADISEVLFRLVRDREEFTDRVRRVSHSTKTPLQNAYVAIEIAEGQFTGGVVSPVVREYLNRAKAAVMTAKTEIRGIYNGIRHTRAPSDLQEILRRLQNEMIPLAKAKRCTIALELPDTPLVCEMCVGEMTTALSCLIDNAVKYSYDSHEIRIAAQQIGGAAIRVQICNYGVGIPPETLTQVREVGHRAKVVDPGRHRAGWGLGLPIAIRFIVGHGGTLDIESSPADSAERMEHHRFVTNVTVLLPTASTRAS